MGTLRTSELVSIAYFLAVALMAWRRSVRPAVRIGTSAVALIVAAAVYAVALTGTGPPRGWVAVRDWLPVALLLLSYWLPAALVSGPLLSFERWLLAVDRRVLASRPGRALTCAPRAARELLEAGYLAVYPMVPLGFALLAAAGLRGHADRFWTTVLAAEYLCYFLLPLLPSRPPRDIEGFAAYGGKHSTVRRLNLAILGRASNRWNTFPSGHVAGAAACALAILPLMPAAGAALLALSVLIAAGSVAGRYHYAADAVAGALVAGLVALLLAV